MKTTDISAFRSSREGKQFKSNMKHIHIQNARRAPFIGPRPLIKDKHVFAFLAIMAAAFAAAWLLTWLGCELKNLS